MVTTVKPSASLLPIEIQPQLLKFVGFHEFDRIDSQLKNSLQRLSIESSKRGIAVKSLRVVKVKPGVFEVNGERIVINVDAKSEL